MAKKKRSFISQHITGWCLAAVATIGGVIVNGVYETVMAPVQAGVAANQLEDSTAAWVLHYQTSFGHVIPNLIIAVTFITVIICLLPTIKHAYKMAKLD